MPLDKHAGTQKRNSSFLLTVIPLATLRKFFIRNDRDAFKHIPVYTKKDYMQETTLNKSLSITVTRTQAHCQSGEPLRSVASKSGQLVDRRAKISMLSNA